MRSSRHSTASAFWPVTRARHADAVASATAAAELDVRARARPAASRPEAPRRGDVGRRDRARRPGRAAGRRPPAGSSVVEPLVLGRRGARGTSPGCRRTGPGRAGVRPDGRGWRCGGCATGTCSSRGRRGRCGGPTGTTSSPGRACARRSTRRGAGAGRRARRRRRGTRRRWRSRRRTRCGGRRRSRARRGGPSPTGARPAISAGRREQGVLGSVVAEHAEARRQLGDERAVRGHVSGRCDPAARRTGAAPAPRGRAARSVSKTGRPAPATACSAA